jgi:sugar-specific transcriptional regulator TrmB
MIRAEDTHVLTMLGLTSSQAKLYLIMLKIGRADVKTVARHSGVARQEIYRILCELQESGLVEKIIAKPYLFEAIPLQDGLSILLTRKAEDYNEAREKTKSLLQKFESKAENVSQEYALTLIPKGEAVIKRIGNMLRNAQTSVDLVTTMVRFMQANHQYFAFHKEGAERGVKFRVITEKPKDDKAFSKEMQELWFMPCVKIRYICQLPKANVAIFDGKEAMVTVYPATGLTESPCIWTNHSSLLAIYQDHFETVWRRALKYKAEER